MGAGADVFAVWAYALANAKPHDKNNTGYVELNPALISVLIGMSKERVEAAIRFLESPDPYSRSTVDSGRRIVKEGQYLYRIVNFSEYRKIRAREERREYQRKWVEKKRSKIKGLEDNCRQSVDCRQVSTMSTQAEAEAEAEAYKNKLTKVNLLSKNDVTNDKILKNSSVKDAVQVFAKVYFAAVGKKYPIVWGRDCKCMKPLVDGGIDLAELERLAGVFLSNGNKFKGNCNIPSFVKAIPRLNFEQEPEWMARYKNAVAGLEGQ